MKPNKLRSFSKELIEAVSRGSAAKVKIIFASFFKVLENSDLKEPPNLKVRESENNGFSSLNVRVKNNEEIRNLKILVNCKDKHGLTPLQIAASFGFHEICKLLIDNGAEIDTQRENCPNLLMLAASNNHSYVVRLLLEYDVTVSCPNLVYAAADEAASKGHIEVKDLIHSHMINRALDDFMKTRESDLCINLRNSLYELLMIENKHPVRLILFMQENIKILKNLCNCTYIFHILCEQQFKQAKNENLSWECHKIAHTFAIAEESLYFQKNLPDDSSAKKQNILDSFIKFLLKDQPKNGCSRYLLIHIRDSIFKYPFKDSNIYRTREIQPIESFYHEFTCETCRNRHGLKWCSRCRNIKYCSQTCQKLHWFVHKIECKKLLLSCQEMAKALETKLSLNN